jgi:hypothetical protein
MPHVSCLMPHASCLTHQKPAVGGYGKLDQPFGLGLLFLWGAAAAGQRS